MTLHRADLEPVRRFADHEHRELARGLEQIHDVACAISGSATIDLSAHVLQLLGWIDGTLEPHLQWEDAWLDPEIDARLGTVGDPGGTLRPPADPGDDRARAGRPDDAA
jgi:hypothetical protein